MSLSTLRHRQHAQISAFALFAMLILTGALALVVDAGVFFVTQRQLQTAVDAAALAAVWYDPVCTYLADPNLDCKATVPPNLPPHPSGWAPCGTPADCVADALLQENLGYSGRLCTTLEPVPGGRTDTVPPSGPFKMTWYIMTVHCDAPYWFARVFPSIPAFLHMTVFARATIGYPTQNGVTPIKPISPPPVPAIVSQLVT